ncbi:MULTISPECIES: DUF3791 domain-containing protein [unclassified Adlercreutzia]|uniref:DUF3791 domain-containing protein n=1 Tax=unclassified Adlercreutzia TaxID=2636013 RepID=UPI0013EC4875|nr:MULTISPECIES: DUF3791 domain-containing protein [unclassified Adlercreutzia]
MPKEFSFFAFLIESYAQSRNLKAAEVFDALDKQGRIGFVYDMYEMYHTESLDNAFTDLDSLIATGRPAW